MGLLVQTVGGNLIFHPCHVNDMADTLDVPSTIACL